jgi:hypothetical protein
MIYDPTRDPSGIVSRWRTVARPGTMKHYAWFMASLVFLAAIAESVLP